LNLKLYSICEADFKIIICSFAFITAYLIESYCSDPFGPYNTD